MEFFSDNWLLWAAFFVPSALWLLAEKARGTPLPLAGPARLCAYLSGTLLVFGAIHVVAELIVGTLLS